VNVRYFTFLETLDAFGVKLQAFIKMLFTLILQKCETILGGERLIQGPKLDKHLFKPR
jgi:hypothetical protein